jgi:hypothetical protein
VSGQSMFFLSRAVVRFLGASATFRFYSHGK